MSDNTSPREKMLKKIRKALLAKRANPYPMLDEPMDAENADMPEIIFAEQLSAAGGEIIFCEDEIQFIENLLLLAEKRNWHKMYCWERKLQALLDNYEYPYFATDKDFEKAEVGLTLCEALIARNGSVLVSNSNGAGRKLSIYPPVHIVLAYTSQLVFDLKDGLSNLKNRYAQNMPSMVSLVTGLSHTNLVNNTVLPEVQGTKELFVFLLDG